MSVGRGVFLMLWCLLLVTGADAAFYRYQDADGRSVFVDDLDKVPAAFKDAVRVYPEAVDAMTEDQRKAADAENERLQQHQRQHYLQHIRKLDGAPGTGTAAGGNPPATTPIQVTNNQVLVPVKMGYGGVTTEAMLLLDTGANVTTIHQEVADALGLRWPKRGSMQVVGGRRIRAGLGTLEHLTLGALRLDDIEVGIISHQGAQLPYAGLLGMNVLSLVAFRIDLENQVIIWQRRSGADPAPPPAAR